MSETLLAAVTSRPASAVSHGVGIIGLVGLFSWLSIALYFGLDGPYSSLVNVAACGVPMVLWSIFVDKVHRNPTTGIDWDAKPRPLAEVSDTSLTKLAGFWATWAIIAGLYCIFRFYWRDNYLFAMEMFTTAAPILFVLSIPYVFWVDQRLIEPRDSVWHFGAWVTGRDGADNEEIYKHLRSWAVKGFYIAFMVSIVPPNFRGVVAANFSAIQTDPVALIVWLINLMFVIDVAMATNGYLLTMRPLDSHIRSATPYAAGWAAALMCYPPFIMMGGNGPLDYHPQTAEWSHWLAPYPPLLYGIGAILVFLTAIYAWATVAFGIRFSNLTDRGILTHGPYAWTKHPAYVSKNLFWWLATMPFFALNGSLTDVIRNCAILAMVSGIYYWRAKTEEWHLSVNGEYRDYVAWMEINGMFARVKRLHSRPAPQSSVAPAE
ncbi:MAG: isoprenylcysteine carboxylmethyltransferase family protein [Sphingomonadaceae bacterium]